MRTFKLAVLPAAMAALVLAGAATNAAAERHYDCTKAGNANKAECKAAATKPAATPVAAAPAPMAKAAPAPAPAPAKVAKAPKAPKAASGTRSPAQLANDQKMKDCGAKWRGLSPADKAKYDTMGQSRKDKNGHAETGWITFSSQCRKA